MPDAPGRRTAMQPPRRARSRDGLKPEGASAILRSMLTELVIRDLALIESAEVERSSGLNALTGETGAGKSLFVGALELLRGATPRGGAASWVRREAAHARVEGRFQLADALVLERVRACLQEELPELAE